MQNRGQGTLNGILILVAIFFVIDLVIAALMIFNVTLPVNLPATTDNNPFSDNSIITDNSAYTQYITDNIGITDNR